MLRVLSAGSPLPRANLLGRRLRNRATFPTLEQTTAWVAAVGSASALQQNLINRLFVSLSAAGVLPKIDDVWWRATETEAQARISLLRLAAVTANNSPPFLAGRGVMFNGSNQYDDTGFVPITHAAVMTATDQWILSCEDTNVAAGSAASAGSTQDAGKNITLFPRGSGGGVVNGRLCSGTPTGTPVNSDSRNVVLFRRVGSVQTFFIDGVKYDVTEGSLFSQMSNLALYLGSDHSGAGANSFRLGVSGIVALGGGSLTDAEAVALTEAIKASLGTASVFRYDDIYVATTGSDTAGNGTEALPFLTVGLGWFATPPGGTVNLEDGTYASTRDLNLTSSVSFVGVNPLGATLAGKLTTAAINLAPATVASFSFTGLVIDPSLDSDGAATNAVFLRPATDGSTYNVTFDACKLQGAAGTGTLVRYGTVGYSVNFEMTDTELVCGNGGGLNLAFLEAGSTVLVSGGSAVQVDVTTGTSAYAFTAQAAGSSVTLTNLNVTSDIGVGYGPAGTFTSVNVSGLPATISGGTFTVTSDVVGAFPQGYPLRVAQSSVDELPDEFPISGTVIHGVTATANGWGGAILELGDDRCLYTLAVGCRVYDCTLTGGANAFDGGLHGQFIVGVSYSEIGVDGAITIDYAAIGNVDKNNAYVRFANIHATRCDNHFLIKGSLASDYDNCSGVATAAFGTTMINYTVSDFIHPDLNPYGSATFRNGTYENDGATGFVFINAGDPLFGLAVTGCTFILTSGTLAAQPFRTPLGNFDKAGFNAAYPGNTFVGF